MKCDELKAYKGDVTIPVYGTIADAEVYLKKDVDKTLAEKDKEIAELKKKLMPCLNGDCILTCEVVEKYGKENAELKHTIDELVVVKKSAELILQNLLDCGLIKEWYFNGKFNAVLKADDPHLKIAELKQKLENVQASMYADVVDANMENRRLKRALWLARAELCRRLDVDRYLRKHNNSWYYENCLTWADACVAMEVKMCKAESKCRAMAEEYK